MRAVNRKIRSFVIELLTAQLDDVGFAAKVFRMAGAALKRCRVSEPPVEATGGAHICRDILVAREAKLRLPAAVAAIVAVRAALFVFRVGVAQLARHEQRLRVDRAGVTGKQEARDRHESPYDMTELLPHVPADGTQ